MSRGGGWVRHSTRVAIHLRDAFTCVYCGGTAPAVRLTLDHLVDRQDHVATNLVTACMGCNSSRKNHSVRSFALRRGLCPATVWKRIRTQQGKDIRGYRAAVNTLLASGIDLYGTVLAGSDGAPSEIFDEQGAL